MSLCGECGEAMQHKEIVEVPGMDAIGCVNRMCLNSWEEIRERILFDHRIEQPLPGPPSGFTGIKKRLGLE